MKDDATIKVDFKKRGINLLLRQKKIIIKNNNDAEFWYDINCQLKFK